MTVEFVTFYADGGKPGVTLSGDPGGVEQIALLRASIRLLYPDARITVLSDTSTDLGTLAPDVAILRYSVDPDRIMFERMRVQSEYLDQCSFSRPIMLVDTDILVTGDLAEVFKEPFDIAFTWRESDDMPINGGVIFLNNRAPALVRSSFASMLKVYKDMFGSVSTWYGDQFAILKFLDCPFSEIYKSSWVERGGAVIRLLPCSVFNYSPEGTRPNLGVRRPDARIYHFKGLSRRLMRPFWDIHLDPDRKRGLSRWLMILRLNFRMRRERRTYRSRFKRDLKRFNSAEQQTAALVDRSEIAGDFVARIHALDGSGSVTDLGGAETNLKHILGRRGLAMTYGKYPQRPASGDSVNAVGDIDTMPASDIFVLLDGLDDNAELRPLLHKLAQRARWLVIGQNIESRQGAFTRTMRKLGRTSRLSPATYRQRLEDAGFLISDNRMTFNERSIVWLCRKRDTL